MATCNNADSILEAAQLIKVNGEKLNKFVNGTATETVPLGTGAETPTIRNVVANAFKTVAVSMHDSIDAALAAIPSKEDDIAFLHRICDENGKFLFGIRADGSVEWSAGVPRPVREFVERFAKSASFPAGVDVFRIDDANGKTLFSIKKDGSVDWKAGVPQHVRAFIEKNISTKSDPASTLAAVVEDKNGKALRKMASNGDSVAFGKQTINGDLKVTGGIDCGRIKGVCNWSSADSIKLPELPKCATINIKSFARPSSKLEEVRAVMEFWDGRGNYFEKNVLMGLQGNTTWNLPKPNYKFDIIQHGWEDVDEDGDVLTCDVQFGEWVPSDSYHLKAFYTDITKCRAPVCYKIWDEINKTYGYDKDATWKKAMLPADPYAPLGQVPAFSCTQDLSLRMDTGATCRFGSFPCIVYMDGRFHGIFSFQQKKQRENFQMDGKNEKHIHIDGESPRGLRREVPDYDIIEIRNPKSSQLVCWDGTKYDGDTNCKRLINSSDALYDPTNKKHKLTNKVDSAIKSICAAMKELNEKDLAIQAMISGGEQQEDIDAAVEDLKTLFEARFDLDNVIDIVLLTTWISDGDSVEKNTQWTTWDGVKWFLNNYDANGAVEGNSRWRASPGNVTHVMGGTAEGGHPNHIVEVYYFDELCARYVELRDAKILDADHYMKLAQEWMLSVGFDAYEKEFETWPDQNCLGEAEPNSNMWDLVLDSNGKPVRCNAPDSSAEDRALPIFSLGSTYQPGDVVQAAYSFVNWDGSYASYSQMGRWKMICTAPAPCTGIPPFKQTRQNAPDSAYSVYSWLKLRQAKVDAYFGYNAQ